MESSSCVVCRRRKIKCDRRPITCVNCAKFGEPCTYRSASAASSPRPDLGKSRTTAGAAVARCAPTSTTTQAGLQRRRIMRSCAACKRAKAKCSGGVCCARCTRRAITCVYDSRRAAQSEGRSTEAAASQGAGPADRPAVPANPPGSLPSPDEAPQSAVLSWLAASDLPPVDRLRGLLDIYFARVHTVRCMGFLHMPSFLERLRDPPTLYADEYGLVHAICALAAPFQYAEAAGRDTTAAIYYTAGRGWAATAMQRIFDHLGTPDVESLMTEMLVHEYYLRCGEYAKAFMLSGVVVRHLQVLQLNLEHDCNLPSQPRRAGPAETADRGDSVSWATKESRRRLAWCCYLQDALMECGIDQLRFVNPADIQVQLPCAEALFVRSRPCVTEMLALGKLLPFVRPDDSSSSSSSSSSNTTTSPPSANLDLRAYYIRAMAVRAKVLKYVKHLHEDPVPWSPDPSTSRFARLDAELRALEASIPDDLRMTPENTCMLRWASGPGRLGLYFGLHILLAQTCSDLYRIGVDNLVFPHHATQGIRARAPLAFRVRCHRVCSTKAVAVASLLEELWQTDRLGVVDTPYAMHAQVCSSVLVMTLLSWRALVSRCANNLSKMEGRLDPAMVPISLPQHRRLLESNVAILDFLRAYIKADLYYESARQALRRFKQIEKSAQAEATGRAPVRDGEAATEHHIGIVSPAATTPDTAADAPQFSLEYILNPLGVYPMARKQSRNRHEPHMATPPAAASSISAGGMPSPAARTPAVDVADTIPEMSHEPSVPQPVFDPLQPTFLPSSGTSFVTTPQALLPLSMSGGALGAVLHDAGEASLFQMWDWESEAPSMDNMGYPTFLDAFPAVGQ